MTIIFYMDIIKLLIFSVAAVVYLYLMSKIMGKKALAQLDFIDFTISISIGSIASEFATDIEERPFYYYLIAMAVFVVFHLLMSFLERKGIFFKKILRGKPLLLICDGKIDYGSLKKSRLETDDVIEMCRDKGYFDLSSVAFAIFETSGKLSILPTDAQRPAVAGDLPIPLKQSSLPLYAVIDGVVSDIMLKNLSKDEEWLLKKLNVSSKKELENILLAIYDEDLGSFKIHYKDESKKQKD